MRIASRPAWYFPREFTVMEGEDQLTTTINEHIQMRLPLRPREGEDQRDSVVFTCPGQVKKTYSKGISYNFFVELSPQELICGLAILPPDVIAGAVAEAILIAERAHKEMEIDGEPSLADGKMHDSAFKVRIGEAANAINRGLVVAILANTDTPEALP